MIKNIYKCDSCLKDAEDNGPYETGNMYVCQDCYEDACERAEYLAECQEDDRRGL